MKHSMFEHLPVALTLSASLCLHEYLLFLAVAEAKLDHYYVANLSREKSKFAQLIFARFDKVCSSGCAIAN